MALVFTHINRRFSRIIVNLGIMWIWSGCISSMESVVLVLTGKIMSNGAEVANTVEFPAPGAYRVIRAGAARLPVGGIILFTQIVAVGEEDTIRARVLFPDGKHSGWFQTTLKRFHSAFATEERYQKILLDSQPRIE